MKKRIFTFLAALCALATIPASATWSWVTEGTKATDGSWTLTVDDDEIDGVTGLKVTGQTTNVNASASTDLDLSTFETDLGRKIIRTTSKLFWKNASLTSVIAPTVLRVESQSFSEIKTLTNAQFAAATYLGDYAFQADGKLTSVSFPDQVTYIGGQCFYQCKFTLANPNWPQLTTLGGGAFQSGPTITGDVKVPGLKTLSNGFTGIAAIKSIYAPNVTKLDSGSLSKCNGLTNLTIKGSTTALANTSKNMQWNTAPKVINWLGDEAPTTMPEYALYDQSAQLFRIYANAPKTSVIQAWQERCNVTAKQIAEDDDYAHYQKIKGYIEVKDRLIGFIGTCKVKDSWGNISISSSGNNGPCWVINTQDVEEEVIYQATITAPDHSTVEKVTADGVVKEKTAEGTYELASSSEVAITYRADAGYQFEGALSVYTQTDVTPAETIGPDVCEKSISAVTYRKLTLSTSELAAAHIASVALKMDEPYLCTTNGDSIVYSVYDGVAFTLVYTAAQKYRFEDAAKTSSAEYPDGITVNTVVPASALPETSVCTWKYTGGVVTDDNWSFSSSIVTIYDVTGIQLEKRSAGDGDLDLTKFREESGSSYDVISIRDWVTFDKNSLTALVGPELRKVQASCGSGVLRNVYVPNAVEIGYNTFNGSSQLTNLVFSANVRSIGQGAFGNCSAVPTFGKTVWTNLSYLGTATFQNTRLKGDIVIPEVTSLGKETFSNTKITSLYAPTCAFFDNAVISGCAALTNVVIGGSKGCFCPNPEAHYNGAMEGTGKVETMRYLSENAPTNFPNGSIYTAKTDEPMMLYVNLKGANSYAGWTNLCTATAAEIADTNNAATAGIRLIPNYKTVRKQGLVGYIGTVTTKDGAFKSVGAANGNGPCWVVDGDWRAPGMMLIIK